MMMRTMMKPAISERSGVSPRPRPALSKVITIKLTAALLCELCQQKSLTQMCCDGFLSVQL